MWKDGKNRKCVEKKCLECGNIFNSRTDRNNLFCSKKCASIYNGKSRIKERYTHVCYICGKTYYNLKEYSKYCSIKCMGLNQAGENNPMWKSGRIIHKGYSYILNNNYKYSTEHRKIYEDFIGRPLLKDEVVHHINENKLDNRLENLQLMTKGEHISLHKKGNIVPDIVREKISKTLTGRKGSEELKQLHKKRMLEYWSNVRAGLISQKKNG